MNRVVEILMKRDNISKSEAEALVEQTREEIEECCAQGMYDYDAAEEAIYENLGLELDYVFDIMGY